MGYKWINGQRYPEGKEPAGRDCPECGSLALEDTREMIGPKKVDGRDVSWPLEEETIYRCSECGLVHQLESERVAEEFEPRKSAVEVDLVVKQ